MASPSFSPTTLIIMRHGEVDPVEKGFYSQRDVSLSIRGIRQSQEAALYLGGIPLDLVASSDLSRCLFMAREVSGITGAELWVDSRFREVDFGQWSGLTWQEIEERWPGQLEARMADLENYRPPEGENLEDVARRVEEGLSCLVSSNEGKTILLVAHGGVNRVIISRSLGMPLGGIFRLGQSFCSLNVVEVYGDGNRVVQLLNAGVREGVAWLRGRNPQA